MLQLGKETRIQALGQWWTVGRLELRVIREFKAWIEARLDDPLALGQEFFALLPVEEQLARVKRAEDVKRQLRNFSLKCSLTQEFLETEEGMAEFARLMLSAHHPDVTAETAFLIMQEAGPQLQAALDAAAGESPRPNALAPAA